MPIIIFFRTGRGGRTRVEVGRAKNDDRKTSLTFHSGHHCGGVGARRQSGDDGHNHGSGHVTARAGNC